MNCDIIIPIWNQYEDTKTCIEYIAKNTRYPHRLILVDNGSEAETKRYLESVRDANSAEVMLIRNEENLGFVKAVNQGMAVSTAPYVCILNNDTLPGEGWLSELVDFAEKHPDVGLVNPLCNGHLPRKFTVNEYARLVATENIGRYMEMNQCQGFCMLIKRDLINIIGYLDERFGLGGFDDTDYSMRAHKAGYRSVCAYTSYVYHREHASFSAMGDRKKLQREAEKAYFKKWPRHLRVGLAVSLDKDAPQDSISGFLKAALFLAREWCWVNLWVFGPDGSDEKIRKAEESIGMPLHQNIKYNYFERNFKNLQILVRLVERNFGTKRRKRYDLVLTDNKKTASFLRMFSLLHGMKVEELDHSESGLDRVNTILKDIRK